MSNVTTGRFLSWDAVDTTGLDTNHVLRIRMLAWVSTSDTDRDIATDDDLKITNFQGDVFLEKRAEGAGDGIDPITFSPAYPLEGIKIPVLGGGKLFIALDKEIV